ncbi:HNH endonuclease [Hymenobacter norwichensis]|uniref:HNH endonuclease n=1 Tax=Hymenobacter norwichensis TaxID=223903 RepID=UPI0012FA2DFB|nr:HNH endonuclease signature motif containing protein [Hymenobacter norwichensis]
MARVLRRLVGAGTGSERLLAEAHHLTLEEVAAEYEPLPPVPVGRVKKQLVKVRVNQQFFRRTVLAAYDNTCCVTGLRQPALLVAGYIKPWAADEVNRLNPRNEVALNALHDRAFELGLFTIRPAGYVVEIAPAVRAGSRSDAQAGGITEAVPRAGAAAARPAAVSVRPAVSGVASGEMARMSCVPTWQGNTDLGQAVT